MQSDPHQGKTSKSGHKGLGVVNPAVCTTHNVVEEEYAIIREVFGTPSAHTLHAETVSTISQLVKCKETVGNSWTVLKVILGQKYHHNN